MNFSIALNSNPHRPNVFNRLSLQFTIKLLGAINPSLVWQIKGIIASVVVVANTERNPLLSLDLFKTGLDSYTLKRTVKTLGEFGMKTPVIYSKPMKNA